MAKFKGRGHSSTASSETGSTNGSDYSGKAMGYIKLKPYFLTSLFSALVAFTLCCMEITQPRLPGSGVHKYVPVMTARFPTLGFNFGEIRCYGTLEHNRDKYTTHKCHNYAFEMKFGESSFCLMVSLSLCEYVCGTLLQKRFKCCQYFR